MPNEGLSEETLLPCPHCGSHDIDPEGWASVDRVGPACSDCGATADTVALWNSRPSTPDDREAIARINERDRELVEHVALAVQAADGAGRGAMGDAAVGLGDEVSDWGAYVARAAIRAIHAILARRPSTPSAGEVGEATNDLIRDLQDIVNARDDAEHGLPASVRDTCVRAYAALTPKGADHG